MVLRAHTPGRRQQRTPSRLAGSKHRTDGSGTGIAMMDPEEGMVPATSMDALPTPIDVNMSGAIPNRLP